MIVLLAVAGCEEGAVQPVPEPVSATSCPKCSPSAAEILPARKEIADVADQVTPSVVSILSERSGPVDSGGLELELPGLEGRRRYDLGSGVIVSSDGAIVTSSHVVDHANKIRVALKDGRTLDARVVGTDPESDVAVIRVDATGLPPIPVADSTRLRTGDLVLAIGNPFGVGQTVTMGIVSAVGRSNMGITKYDEFIQTDAAINPGNSGGALVDMNGELVGINTAIISKNGGFQGIGFAIPSRLAMQVKDALLEHGKVERGWLGVELEDLTEDVALMVGVAARAGVLITDVQPDSPAAAVGLEPGDVITAIDGTKTVEAAQLRNTIAMTTQGTPIRLDVLRREEPRTVTAVLRAQPAEEVAESETPGSETGQTAETGLFAGVTVQTLDAATRAKLEVPDELDGVVISAIEAGSVASFLGFRVGDVIVEVNRTETESPEAFHDAIAMNANEALVLVFRDGATIIVSVTAHGE